MGQSASMWRDLVDVSTFATTAWLLPRMLALSARLVKIVDWHLAGFNTL